MTPKLSTLFSKCARASSSKRRRALLISIKNELARPRPVRLASKRLRISELQPQGGI